MIEVVEIDGRRWYKENGQIYPSATSVLDILFPEDKAFVPETALAFGTTCHEEIAKAIVAYVHGRDYIPNEDKRVSSRVEAAFRKFREEIAEVIAVESPIIFCGVGMTPDLVGIKRDGTKCLWDWKFAESMSDRYFFQANLYRRAEGVMEGAIVQVRRDATIRHHPCPMGTEWDVQWELIRSAINVRNHRDRKEKRYV